MLLKNSNLFHNIHGNIKMIYKNIGGCYCRNKREQWSFSMLFLMIVGPGKLSLDAFFAKQKSSRE